MNVKKYKFDDSNIFLSTIKCYFDELFFVCFPCIKRLLTEPSIASLLTKGVIHVIKLYHILCIVLTKGGRRWRFRLVIDFLAYARVYCLPISIKLE